MKAVLIFLITLSAIVLFNTEAYQRARFGYYTIEGIVLTLDNVPIDNEKIVFEDDTIRTDSAGRFLVKMYWVAGECSSHKSKCSKLMNPEYLTFKYKGYKTFIPNKWRKYGLKDNCKNQYRIKVYFPIIANRW